MLFDGVRENRRGRGMGWDGEGGGGGGKPLMSFKTRSRFSYCGTPLSVRPISIHSEAYMKFARCWEQPFIALC